MTRASYGIIYVWTNTENGKQYVGQTTTESKHRQYHHLMSARNGRRLPLYNAIRKYGEGAFAIEVIHICLDKDELDYFEGYYIDTLNTLVPHGYNLRGGGSNGKFSDQMRANHSKSMKELSERMPELAERRTKSVIAFHANPENKERHRLAVTEGLNRPGMHEKLSEAITKALNDPSVRQKLSDAAHVRYADPEFKARHLAGIQASQARPEVKQKMSEAQLRLWTDPEVRERRSAAIKAGISTPEARKNMSEAQKAACSRPEVIERKSAAAKEVNKRPGVKERRSAALKQTWSDPEVKAAFLAIVQSDEHREKMRQLSSATMSDPAARSRNSTIATKLMQDPEYRKRHKDAHNTPEFIAWVQERTTGTIWINDGATSRRIKADQPIPEGWQHSQLYGGDPEVRKRVQLLARHTRWHVKRGVVSPNCRLCNSLDQN